jgi:hypothetical protein
MTVASAPCLVWSGLLVLLLACLPGAVAFAGCPFAGGTLFAVLVAAGREGCFELLLACERLRAACYADWRVLFDFEAVRCFEHGRHR